MNSLFVEWFGSITGIVGALLVALNIPLSGWGFVLFFSSSVSLTAYSLSAELYGIGLQQAVFSLINLLGIWRWLIKPRLNAQVAHG